MTNAGSFPTPDLFNSKGEHTMKRHYYIGDNLEDMASAERGLEAAGISTPQIHVLSNDDAGVELSHLHEVEAVLKKTLFTAPGWAQSLVSSVERLFCHCRGLRA
jgi:hypothetical protein